LSFASIPFIFFYTAVCITYFLISPPLRWILLLGVSYLFYGMWNPAYLILLAICTLGNYAAGIGIYAGRGRERKVYLFVGLATSIGVLFTCRYIGFFNHTIESILGILGFSFDLPAFPFLLPLGVSFYTLQALSYTIDIYREKRVPEYHLGIFALYVSFFPQLLAGPIERATSLLPQFRIRHTFDRENATIALRLILWGYFKKLVVADRLSVVVDTAYANPAAFDGTILLIATYLFSFQIYCDFSAYTDIARGTAKIMGFELTENFHRPYLAASVSDFWRRWHISLSRWIRDYVYIPLGGKEGSRLRCFFNLSAAFLLSGLWHGANWTFILWGLIHAVFVSFERAVKGFGKKFHRTEIHGLPSLPRMVSKIFITYHCVVVGWVFFRSQDVGQAFFILERIFSRFHLPEVFFPGMDAQGVIIIMVSVACVIAFDIFFELRSLGYRIPACPAPLRWVGYTLGVWAVFLYSWMKPYKFIYFVF